MVCTRGPQDVISNLPFRRDITSPYGNIVGHKMCPFLEQFLPVVPNTLFTGGHSARSGLGMCRKWYLNHNVNVLKRRIVFVLFISLLGLTIFSKERTNF